MKPQPDLELAVDQSVLKTIVASGGDWTHSYSKRCADKSEVPEHLLQAKFLRRPITITFKGSSKKKFTTEGYVTKFTTLIDEDCIRLTVGLTGRQEPTRSHVWSRKRR